MTYFWYNIFNYMVRLQCTGRVSHSFTHVLCIFHCSTKNQKSEYFVQILILSFFSQNKNPVYQKYEIYPRPARPLTHHMSTKLWCSELIIFIVKIVFFFASMLFFRKKFVDFESMYRNKIKSFFFLKYFPLYRTKRFVLKFQYYRYRKSCAQKKALFQL